ncbi:bifunctional diguanylate cyclase/phosphodiesterase [Pontibacillus yanchengensis]|uniref:bifunctional diguanylate cyclase/phosphodiesterase n=1 Tax=Pontibacillus yanchengensis TaxID=462910 RepID=UPI00136C34C6|nr:GGDEF domain-containing phosphodiesterase [Pontibacillus yanchengensis]
MTIIKPIMKRSNGDDNAPFYHSNEPSVFKESGETKIVQDSTDCQHIKQQLANKEQEAMIIYNNLEEVVWSIDIPSKDVLFCSNGFEKLYGYTLDYIISEQEYWQSLIHPDDRSKMKRAIEDLLKGEKLFVQYRYYHPSGEIRWIEVKCFPILNDQHQLTKLDGIMWDITDKKHMEERKEYLAYHDYLTDLPNRRQFDSRMDELVKNPHSVESFGLLFLDLDRFKHINDMLGHFIGDQLIKEISDRLRECVGHQHFVARMGGDEFSSILYGVDVDQAIEIADQITKQVREPYFIKGYELHITTSIGISMYPFDGEEANHMIHNTDAALYHAKHMGKNTHQIYTPSMNITSHKVYYLEKDIRKAIYRDELFLEYQPKVSSKTGEIMGAEALIRWEHSEWGRVSPGEFIPIAEESDLICEIGNWVIYQVCQQLHDWKRSGIDLVPISINVSPKQLLKENFTQTIMEACKIYSIDPTSLHIEITETSLIQSSIVVNETLTTLKDIGITLSLDDFGIGYSSLTHIRQFDLDVLKIDKSFINNLPDQQEDVTIISSLITMAHGLGLKIVAEGVEKQDQLSFLQQQECDYIQGYLFSKPILANEFITLLNKNRLQNKHPHYT